MTSDPDRPLYLAAAVLIGGWLVAAEVPHDGWRVALAVVAGLGAMGILISGWQRR